MFRRLAPALLAVLTLPLAGIAQPPKVDDVRVITNERLSILSYTARHYALGKLFKTQELKFRLMMIPPTDSILVASAGNGATDIVWYTDPATTQPRPITVTRAEHDLVFGFAEGGLSSVLVMKAGPSTVTEMVTTITPDGKTVTVPVMKTQVVVPSEAHVDAALSDIAKVRNADVRSALELAAGAKFAELFPPNTALRAPAKAAALAENYRKTVYDDAVKQFAAKPAALLPPVNEPILFGRTHVDLLSVARAVEGAEPVASFETDAGRFAAVWDKSTLVLVRQPKDQLYSTDHKLRLSESWMRALDPKNKDTRISPLNPTTQPDPVRVLVVPP